MQRRAGGTRLVDAERPARKQQGAKILQIDALKVHPSLNAGIDTEKGEVTYYDYENVAIAVDTEKGLLTPVIKNAGDLNVAGLSDEHEADIAFEVMDEGYHVLNKADDEDDDTGEEQRVRKLHKLQPGRYYVHVYGQKRLFLAGISLFTVASFVAGLSPSFLPLVIARGFQGIGAAITAATALAILAATFPEGRARNRALGGESVARREIKRRRRSSRRRGGPARRPSIARRRAVPRGRHARGRP